MTDEPRAFSAVYVTYDHVPTRGVVKFIFEVEEDKADDAHAILGGTPRAGRSVWVGITPIRNPSGSVADRPAVPPPAGAAVLAAAPPRQSWYDMKLSQRAALLCRDTRFWEWVNRDIPNAGDRLSDEAHARHWMLARYRIASRSELDMRRELFERDELAFRVWAGLEPDPRR